MAESDIRMELNRRIVGAGWERRVIRESASHRCAARVPMSCTAAAARARTLCTRATRGRHTQRGVARCPPTLASAARRGRTCATEC